METSPSDRLANLFTTGSLPSKPSSDQAHIIDQDAAVMVESTKSSWKIPEQAEYPRQVHGERPKPASGADLLTNSDDDDYVAAFTEKPKMKTARPKWHDSPQPRKMPEADAHGYLRPCRIEAKAPIEYVANDKLAQYIDDQDDELPSPIKRVLPQDDGKGNAVTGHFCVFTLVAKFPYKYMQDGNGRVSRHFFANNKFFERQWDLYYLQPPASVDSRPILLLPYHQVEHLVGQISSTFKVSVSVPPYPFTMSFFKDGTPQPEKLGTTKSRADINDVQDSIPAKPANHGEPPPDATVEQLYSFAAFKAKCEKACARNKKSGAAVKRKKAQDRLLTLQDWCKQLRRAQRYFGLRDATPKAPMPDPNLDWAEQQAFHEETEKKLHKLADPLDVSQLAPCMFEQQPIILSIDVESYERDHSIVTEVGISTLDTLDLVGIPPGEGGDDWTKQIRSRHFRVSGRERYVNKDFCPGDGNAFQFGESEFISVEKIGDAIDDCLQWPFSVHFKHDGTLKWQSQSWKDGVAAATDDAYAPSNGNTKTTDAHAEPETDAKPYITSSKNGTTITQLPSGHIQLGGQERTIILVGHDISGDLKDLASLNSAVFSRPRPPTSYPPPPAGSSLEDDKFLDERAAKGKKILERIPEAIDTATLYQTLTKDSQTRNLPSVLTDLGRCGWFFHNAGNDARYTLEALIALVVRARLEDDEDDRLAEAARLKAEEETEAQNKAWMEGATPIPNEETSSSPSPAQDGDSEKSAWEQEKERRMNEKLAATRKEVEADFAAWEAAGATGTRSRSGSPGSQSNSDQVASDHNDAVDDRPKKSFAALMEATHDKGAKKKSASDKRREYELRVRAEDGVEGPCDFNVAGESWEL